MSFVQSHADPAARAKAIIVVGGVHALIGAGLVLGLTYTGVVKPDIIIEVWDVPTTPTPEETTAPPEQTDPVVDNFPPVAPLPPIDLSTDISDDLPWVDNTPTDQLIPTPLPTPTYAPLPPTPSPSFSPISAHPRNGPTGWITNEDYSASDIRHENEGSASYRLVIGSDGRVDTCDITASTGFATLDRATCRLIERRARFDPAKDQSGRNVVGTYNGRVTWEIPE